MTRMTNYINEKINMEQIKKYYLEKYYHLKS